VLRLFSRNRLSITLSAEVVTRESLEVRVTVPSDMQPPVAWSDPGECFLQHTKNNTRNTAKQGPGFIAFFIANGLPLSDNQIGQTVAGHVANCLIHFPIFSAHSSPAGSDILLNSMWITRLLLALVVRLEACCSSGRISMTPPFLTRQVVSASPGVCR